MEGVERHGCWERGTCFNDTKSLRNADIRRSKIENQQSDSARFIQDHIDMIDSGGVVVIGWLASQAGLSPQNWQLLE